MQGVKWGWVLAVSRVCCCGGRCGAAEGCLFPDTLRDADGKIGVNFRTCDLKARPVTVSGTTPLPPETARTGDMAAWTSGAHSALSYVQASPLPV